MQRKEVPEFGMPVEARSALLQVEAEVCFVVAAGALGRGEEERLVLGVRIHMMVLRRAGMLGST